MSPPCSAAGPPRAFLLDTQAHYAFTGPNAAEVGQLQFLTIDTLVNGTTGNDSPTGSFIGERLNGLAGNDTITGGGGADTIDGGSGDDQIAGGIGDNTYVFDSADHVVTEPPVPASKR